MDGDDFFKKNKLKIINEKYDFKAKILLQDRCTLYNEKRKKYYKYNNKIYEEWNKNQNKLDLINYILPTEDLEDLNLIKSKYEFIEQYDFKEIINKYDLKDSIITLIFKNNKEARVLSRIKIDGDIKLKNQSFSKVNLNNEENLNGVMDELKEIYEDYWKNYNQINTSIKLTLNIKVNNYDNKKNINF